MIKKEDVLKAYSGHPGCACGCLGKYYYRKTTQELGTKDRGYKVDDDEVSDVQVRRIVNIMNANWDKVQDFGGCFHFEKSKSRVYTVYTIKENE